MQNLQAESSLANTTRGAATDWSWTFSATWPEMMSVFTSMSRPQHFSRPHNPEHFWKS